jgi:hypothetical protein
MSKNAALLLVLVLLTASCLITAKSAFSSAAATENTWVTKTPMQVARADLGVAVVNGDIYAIGGNTITGEYNLDQGFYKGITGGTVNTNEQYDPATDTWAFKTPMLTPRDSFAIAVYQNKIYCIGGRTSIPLFSPQTFTTVNEVYDPATDKWQTKAFLPKMEWPLQASVVNGKIYAIGGSGNTYAYDPTTDSWTTKTAAPYVNASPSFVSTVFDNKIYVIGLGGLNMIYNPLNDTWSLLHSSQPYSVEGLMGYGTFFAAAGATIGILASERIYVFYDNQTYVYEVSNDTWALGAYMPEERVNYGLATVNDTFYVIGGSNYPRGFSVSYGPTAANEQYFPIGYGSPDPSYLLQHSPPKISVLSPLNQTYNESSLSVVFIVDKPVNWTGYSLDGKQNVTITGNTTLTGLSSGSHNVTVYANDTYGNMAASETVTFTIPEPFPVVPVAAVSVAVAVATAAGLLVYFKKHHKNRTTDAYKQPSQKT